MLHKTSSKKSQSPNIVTSSTTVPRRPAPMHPGLPMPKPRTTATGPDSEVVRPKMKLHTPSQRPSALPRSTKASSNQKLETLAASRSANTSNTHTRRAQTRVEDVPLIFDDATDQSYHSHAELKYQHSPYYHVSDSGGELSSLDSHHDTVLGIAMPEKHKGQHGQNLPPRLIPELQALASHKSPTMNRPAPSVSTVSSPSTRLTESPAPWSASTATTTPVSWPSNSPAIAQSSRLPDRKSKTVPQPTVPRSRLPKLPNLQSSSANFRPAVQTQPEKAQPLKQERKTKKKPIADSPAPTPPPRTSSVHRSGSRGGQSGASSIDETLAQTNHSTGPSPRIELSPLAYRTRQNVGQIGESLRPSMTAQVHASLQESIDAAPSRPSREGTIDLGDSRPAVMNSHKSGFSSKHRHLLAPAFEDPPTTLAGPQMALRSTSESSLSDVGKAPPSSSRLGKLSRLGIFSRRGQTTSSDTSKSPRKLQRKGPAAGTGHEGYGKYARRTRKTSTESSAVASDSEQSTSGAAQTPHLESAKRKSVGSSRHNRSSQSDLDTFAAPRMKPVVMRGGSQTNIPQVSDIDQSRTHMITPEASSRRSSSASPAIRSPGDGPPRLRSPKQRIGGPRADKTEHVSSLPTLALRRSQRFGSGHEDFPMPMPIFTEALNAPMPVTSYDTSLSSVMPSSAAPSSSGADFYRADVASLKPQEKKSKRAWWNPFKRKDSQPTPTRPDISPDPVQPEFAVSIAAGPAPRSIPYYAMMESESDNNNNNLSGEFYPEAARSVTHSPVLDAQPMFERETARRTDSVLLPTAPIWLMNARAVEEEEEEEEEEEADVQPSQENATKQPRLPQVGRIPKVVSRSERQHTPSRRSFSQPFPKKSELFNLRAESPEVLQPLMVRPQLGIHTDMLPSLPFPEAVNISAKPASAPAGAQMHQTYPPASSFPGTLGFPSKHSSDVSASSSSDGVISVMGPPLIPFHRRPNLSQRSPQMRINSMHPGEDDVWNEYDDFIDHVMSPSRSPTRDARFNPTNAQIEPMPLKPRPRPNVRQRSPERFAIPEPRRGVANLLLPTLTTDSGKMPSPVALSDKAAMDEIRLRRSRIVSALHSSIDPSSPFSMREFLQDYGRDSLRISDQFSSSTAGPLPVLSPTTAKQSEESSRVEHNRRGNALLLDAVARSKNPARESELHYASLEVSRWLSFGRVLFSPAHDEVHTLPERNVLVVDGLGNEDWSIYCAVNYEAERAVVYDLKEILDGVPIRQSASEHLPPNMRRVQVGDLSERFPFHSSFFSAIILRFPPAMPEYKLRNIVSECRRILVPGGHLEIMLLDLDIVNMGVQTRRAVRELKMSMATTDPDVSLKPGIDNFQTILGTGGFTGFNRCVVGVPVVGRAFGSMDSSSSSRSSHGSGSHANHTSTSPTRNRVHDKHHNFSLNELVADHSDRADAKIGRMVSSCARSWWQHCFEATVIPDGDLSRSIFADRRVLQECKSRASSFKLLIAYAQRPVFETRRRTMSEPAAASLATAGPSRRPKVPAE